MFGKGLRAITAVSAIVLLGVLAFAPGVEAVSFTKPSAGGSTVSVTMTFETPDRFPNPEIHLILTCSTTGGVREEFGIDGTTQAPDVYTVGNAVVTGSLATTGYFGESTGAFSGDQTGYGYVPAAGFGYGYSTANTGVVTGGAGTGYGYLAGAPGQSLTYTFNLNVGAFVAGEVCNAVVQLSTTLAGDFMSERSDDFTPSGGGVGGGGGVTPPASPPASPPGTTPPASPPTSPPTSPPQPGVDSDGDGVSDFAEGILGTDPNDPGDRPGFDITDRLTILFRGGNAILDWPGLTNPNIKGYQVWRSTSPWILLATLGPTETAFTDVDAPEGAKYKVTYFVGDTLAEGFATPENVHMLAGWEADEFADQSDTTSSPTDGDGEVSGGGKGISGWVWLVLGLVIVGIVIAVVVVRNQQKGPQE